MISNRITIAGIAIINYGIKKQREKEKYKDWKIWGININNIFATYIIADTLTN